ncbi:MAG TPA: family 78 glycoside hydrolase catalytic domain [Propionicimonas sp.]|uniref:family 78 glycoside hydrolase catalytic domain n=1 Tax=Propionicimonas sp. TaxID=1955623 RepID=UPI002F3FFB99
MTSVVDSVRLEYRQDSPFVAVPRPRVSWVTRSDVSGWRQLAAELSWNDGVRTVNFQVDGDTSVLVAWPFADLVPRQRGTLRVRTQGVDGWSEWSAEHAVVAAFLGADEWQASFIALPTPSRHAQPVLLRHEFEVAPGLVRATLYATALGVYQAHVNGQAVDDQLLKPGWTPYQYRLVHETTDVTAALSTGSNTLGVALAGGWYTESFGFQGLAKPFYGEQPSFAGQLVLEYEDGTSTWVATGPDWHACGDGPWVDAGIYRGEAFDARLDLGGWAETGFDDARWAAARVVPSGPVPGPRTSPEVRVTGHVPVAEVFTSPSGATLLDFGQNLVGRLRIRVSGEPGTVVTLRHAEVLEDGELGVRPLRVAKATDTYTLAGGGVEDWAPSFTFHGFRFAEVSGWPGEFDPAAVTAEVIGSDMTRTGWFDCSDPMVAKLHENVVWGMRGNFLYLPTDCPQRDERLGWTGDIQVFSPTASYLYDCDGFLASWLVDLALEQEAAGGVPFIVPDVLDSAKVPAAAWGDVATILPWVLYQRFGDVGVLAAQYPSAKGWVDQLLAIAGDRYLWEGGFQFGDWVDPDAPPDLPAKAKADPDLVASAYLFRSADVLARIAAVLGNDADAAFYADVAEKVRSAWLAEYVTPAGRILSDAQTSYALAIEFGIASGELRARMGERLAWLVRRDGYRISTGFVGTPLVTDALTNTGHLRQAGRMLQQTECPSWLYPITMGATTIWERWDSMLEDGSINPGEMTSFNHYALGAVADWMHRVVAGLAPAEPGYHTLEIAPHPLPGLDWASTRHETPYGTAEVEWRRDGDQIVVRALVPANSSAVVRLPGSEPFTAAAGRHEWTVGAAPAPAPATVTTATSLAAIMDDPEAYQAVMAAFNRMSPEAGKEFHRRTAWVPNQPLFGSFSLIAPDVQGEVETSLAQLNASRAV